MAVRLTRASMRDDVASRPDFHRQVAVVTLTYQRPNHIRELLPMLVEQAHAVAGANTTTEVLVVDNDPEATGRSLVAEISRASGRPIRYVHEPQPGIASARNRALDECANADLLVFIDDDERPSEGWLASLVSAHERYGAAAILGPVVTVFVEDAPAWTVAGRYWDRPRWPTGTRRTVGNTGNILLDLQQVRRLGVRFDATLAMGGGEDSLFTQQLRSHGAELVWCDEAVAYDLVPPERTQPRWLMRRRFMQEANRVVVARKLAHSPLRNVWITARFLTAGAAETLQGTAMWCGGLLAGRLVWRSRGTRHVVRGVGKTAGALGYHGQQYKRSNARDDPHE